MVSQGVGRLLMLGQIFICTIIMYAGDLSVLVGIVGLYSWDDLIVFHSEDVSRQDTMSKIV